ncbi:MAG TPA: sigma-70 family RNA polymerase sigma factor [Candidatus Babeliaceae bacterium]|nr:sigma-70 family RNA polymerase sigma factor [Candidatus Babeliaceae bacterium]
MLAIAYNHLKDKQAAEEILQEVFMSLWDRRFELRLDPVSGYLATAVKFSVFKHFSRKKRHQELLDAHYEVRSIIPHDEQIYAAFLAEYINGIVETLPEKCRLVFKYSRQENLTIPEIALEMGIAEKTAEAHLTKALKTIRVALKDSGILLLVAADHFLK